MKNYEQHMEFKFCVISDGCLTFSNERMRHYFLGDTALENVKVYFEGNDKFTTLPPTSLTVSGSIIEYDYSCEKIISDFDKYADPPKVSMIFKIKYLPSGWNELKERTPMNCIYYDIKSICHKGDLFCVKVGKK